MTTALLGAAGEHYVMCQLLRRGMIAALAPTGAPDIDIIVSDRDGTSLAAVQVKARQNTGSKGGWPLHRKHEDVVRASLFYAFVDFGAALDAPPRCWIVPSAEVAAAIKESHSTWLSTPGLGGKAHEDNPVRQFLHDYGHLCPSRTKGWLDRYRERWDSILSAAQGSTPVSP